MNLKEIFKKAENGVLSYDQFMELAGDAKFVDLTEGGYISKSKYENELAGKDSEINTLNTTIQTRDTDLQNLKAQLEAAGTDADKLSTLSQEFESLKGKYDTDTKAYKDQLKKQAYEFAVREYAATKKFTSNAAKRDFINSMIAKDLKMDNNAIMGAEDFVSAYSKDNADAFVSEPEPEPEFPLPSFASPTNGPEVTPQDPTGGFASAFHFTQVHPIKD